MRANRKPILNDFKVRATEILSDWGNSEGYKKAGIMQRYAVCAGLAVCEHAKTAFPLKKDDYMTVKNQVKTSGSFIRNILGRFGVTNSFASEGGRTTRATVPAADNLVGRLNSIGEIAQLSMPDREDLFTTLQKWLVDNKVKEILGRRRLVVEFDFADSTAEFVNKILEAAKARVQGGAVAQHLVGAKLALRFPGMEIENHNFTTADQQLGRKGDFEIHDSIFHVTLAPTEGLMTKMRKNLAEGYRVILIIPSGKFNAADQLAELADIKNRVDIYNVENFIAQNIDELSVFSRSVFLHKFAELLETYNRRVGAVEADKSLLIEVPGQLKA